MHIVLNGQPFAVAESLTLADMIAARHGVAVAVNGEVVPRAQHPAHPLHDGDVVEVVTAVQGG